MPLRLSALLIASLLAVAPTLAAETIAEAETPQSFAQRQQWLQSLGSADFEARKEASRKLVEAGAVEEVARLAATADLETASRCLDVLKRIFTGKDAAAKASAEKALKELSESAHRSIASRAAELIRKPDPSEGRANVFGGNVQIQVQVANGIVMPRAVGPAAMREVNVEENGKKYRIREMPDELIVEVTETVQAGKAFGQKTTEHKAANIFELRKKHPDAAKIFEKHMRGPAANAVAPAGDIPFNRAAVPMKAAAQNLRIQMKNVNGAREIEVEDGNLKLRITDNNGKEIRIEKEETINGETRRTTARAPDYEFLKKNLPALVPLYDKYARGNNGIQVINGAGGIQIQGNIQIEAVPAQALPIQALPIPAIPVPAIPDEPAEARKP